MGLLLALWIAGATWWHLWERLRHAPPGVGLFRRLASLPRSFTGMLVAHAGIAVFVAGVTLVKGLETGADVRMRVGDTVSAGAYTYRFAALDKLRGPNYTSTRGQFEVSEAGRFIATLEPEKRIFHAQGMPMTEAAIDRGLTRDLYMALGEQIDARTWIVRIQHKPFVGWIWAGCLFMAAGGALAGLDRRYRLARKPVPDAGARVAAGAALEPA